MSETEQCPCSSGKLFDECCAQYLEGTDAPTAETLMRARYTAYIRLNKKFLFNTWHPGSRPERLTLLNKNNLVWTGLEIIRVEKGESKDKMGVVEFRAKYTSDEGSGYLHEISNFVKEENHWLYFDGEIEIVNEDEHDDFKDFKPIRRRVSAEP